MQREESTGVLNNEEVDDNDNNPDDQESDVVEETVADVLLVMNLPGGNHVNDLEPDEQVEDESHMAT